jgi:hypothetical protein
MFGIGRRFEFLFCPGPDASLVHDSGNTVFPAADTVIDKIPMDFHGSVYAVAGRMQNTDFSLQGPVFTASEALWTLEPGMATGAGDVEKLANTAYRERLPVGRDELKFHF